MRQVAPAARLLDRLRVVGQPRVQVGTASTFPSLRVQTVTTTTRRAVTAAGHAAATVRALPPPPRIGRRDEPIHHRASVIDPPLQMPLAQAAATGGSLASRDPTRGSAEHRVLSPNSRTSLRNSLRTSAISLPSSPDEPAGFRDGAVTAAPARR